MAVGLMAICCGVGIEQDQAPGKAGAGQNNAGDMSQWLKELTEAYIRGGADGFQAARMSMMGSPSLPADPDYDTVSRALGLRETTITRKEADTATEIRSLAQFIEEHPKQAQPEGLQESRPDERPGTRKTRFWAKP
jgi:hypothetical protein